MVDDWWIGKVLARDNEIGQWYADGWIIDAGLIDLVGWSRTGHRLVNDWHIVRGSVDWSRIGSGLVDWWICHRLALYWHTEPGLAKDWRIVFADSIRIGIGLVN